MKLLLASYLLGDHGPALRRLVGNGTRAGLVFNALDGYGETRLHNLPRERAALEEIGIDCHELDLRTYFGDERGLRGHLDSLDLVWVVGGNTFVLARAMLLSGFHHVASAAVAEGRLVYAGYSAGACVTAPDLRGVDLMDETAVVPDGYPSDVATAALGWIPWRVVPHWRSEHPETAVADAAVKHLLAEGLVFRTMQDGDAIVINGDPCRSGL